MTVLEPVIQFLIDYKGTTVDLSKVMQGADRPRRPVLRVMDRLVREGNLKELDDTRAGRTYKQYGRDRRNPTWEIIKKPLLTNPKSPKCRRTIRDKMWRLIRARRRFTRAELQVLAGAGLGSTEDFTKLLERHGYIRVIGMDGRRKVYMLIKDAGPKRPILKEAKDG